MGSRGVGEFLHPVGSKRPSAEGRSLGIGNKIFREKVGGLMVFYYLCTLKSKLSID